MQKHIAKALLKHAEANGWLMCVECEGEVDYEGKSAAKAWEAVKATTEAHVFFSNADNAKLGWAYLMSPGHWTCAPDESIVDYSSKGLVGEVCDKLTGGN